MLAFCREGVAAALKGGCYGLILIGICRRTKQTAADKKEQIALTHGQTGDICLFGLHRGNDSVVVGHVLIGYHKLHQGIEAAALIKGRHLRRKVDHTGGGFCHIKGKIAAVGTGIGQQFLFIEGLGVIKGLFCRVPENAVGLSLQGGKIVQLASLFFCASRKALSAFSRVCSLILAPSMIMATALPVTSSCIYSRPLRPSPYISCCTREE